MTFWKTAHRNLKCGYCDNRILKGSAYLVLHMSTVKRKFFRCSECAGELPHDVDTHRDDVPPSLTFPKDVYKAHVKSSMRSFSVKDLPSDFKLAQSGEREPGQEG